MVFGVDASTAMIGQARTLWPSWADRLTFDTVETIERLPFEEGRFDGVLCSSVLEYLDDPVACCRELHRVLKPGGLLLFSVPNQCSLIRKAEKTILHVSQRLLSSPMPHYLVFSKNEYSLQHLNQLVSECGFLPHRHGFCGLPPWGPIGQSGWIAPLLFVLAEKRPCATDGGQAIP
jgi:2-polyprenyl-6-hydroxyphenyl methylase/3-demethylubiquinone-9 3-methyltransferase